MKYLYFSLGLELLLPGRQNWVGITGIVAIGLYESFCGIAKVLVITRKLLV